MWLGPFLGLLGLAQVGWGEPSERETTPAHAALAAILHPETLAERVAAVVLILILSYLAYRIAMEGLRRAIQTAARKSDGLHGTLAERQQRAITVLSLLRNVVRWAISLVALIWVLGAIGVNLVPILTGVGFLGAAIAFGSQALVRDLVSGFFILLEGQFAVGDFVEIAGKVGRVEAVGLRTTVLRDARNQHHHIPNGSITITTVLSRASVAYALRVPVTKAEDSQRAAEVLEEMTREAQKQLPKQLLWVGEASVEPGEVGPWEVVVPIAVYPTQDWVALTELPARAKFVLGRHAIELPEGMSPHSVEDLGRSDPGS